MESLKNKTTSIFGKCPEIFKRRVGHWKSRRSLDECDFLVVDDKDGYLGMCPLRSNMNVTVYENDKNLLYGGKYLYPFKNPHNDEIVYKEKTILGFEDRINIEFLDAHAKLINENFYKSNINEKYSYVATTRGLNLEQNIDISMIDKINKLKSCVKDDGYLYIEYYIALDSDDYETYPKNQYLRYGEMKEYFNGNEWDILFNTEKATTESINQINKERKEIILGIIDVRKQKKRVPKKRRNINNIVPIQLSNGKKVRNYTINGVFR